MNRESLITKRLLEPVQPSEDGRQDGEMGHEPNPALTDTSHHVSNQQALLHPEPIHSGGVGSAVAARRDGIRQWQQLRSLRAIDQGELSAQIRLLLVNNPDCGARQRAERLGIPCRVVDHRVIRDRQDLDRELVRQFREAEVEAVVMAGWMRIVTTELIGAFSERLINLHPSLLPSFRGLDGIGQALNAGVRISGCTVHLVTEELDAGPIVAQAAVPVFATDDHASLSTRIQQQEHRLLPAALMQLGRRWRQG